MRRVWRWGGLWLLGLSVACAGRPPSCTEIGLDAMKRQPRLIPYGESDFFADGMAMRQPPRHTVAREAEVDERLATGIVGGAYILQLPVPLSEGLLRAGRKHFEITCAACHGVLGDGRSVVASKAALRPPPNLLRHLVDLGLGGPAVRLPPELSGVEVHRPGYVFEVITHGYGLMPSYAAVLSPAERWAVVAYLAALQLSQLAPFELATEPVRKELLARPAPGPARRQRGRRAP